MDSHDKFDPPASSQTDAPRPLVKRILILGGGSAGLLAALTLKRKVPELSVEVIRSTELGVIAVGEGSTWTLPVFLHGYLDIDPAVFHQLVRPTYKLGIRFHWGPRERFHYVFTSQLDVKHRDLSRPNGYYCQEEFDFADINSALAAHDKAFERQDDGGPLIPHNVAYHMENRAFVDFLEAAAVEAGVTLTDDLFQTAEHDEDGVTSLHFKSGRAASADLYIDCTGFRSELISKVLEEEYIPYDSSLFCDRAVVGGVPRTDEPLNAFTTAETMNAGWAWRIEHDEVVNRGYVYSSSFISDEDAEREFREKNPRIRETRIVRYRSGRHRRSWVKNVVAIGNSAGFVEPLEATAISVITDSTRLLVRSLIDSNFSLNPSIRDLYNSTMGKAWDEIRGFLALHYKFNDRIDNEFWRCCRHDINLAGAEDLVEHFRIVGPSTSWSHIPLRDRNSFGWEGYLVWLLGPAVSHNGEFKPNSAERAIWKEHLAELSQRAGAGLKQEEALPMLRSPEWQWNSDFYKQAAAAW